MNPSDGTPCRDPDRAVGEGVAPVEYLLVKQELVAPFEGKLSVLAGKRVYLAILTLRPEYM